MLRYISHFLLSIMSPYGGGGVSVRGSSMQIELSSSDTFATLAVETVISCCVFSINLVVSTKLGGAVGEVGVGVAKLATCLDKFNANRL